MIQYKTSKRCDFMRKLLLLLFIFIVGITVYFLFFQNKDASIGSTVMINNLDDAGVKLSGASLQVVNQNDEIIDSWVSNGKKHKVSGLVEGLYQVKEVAAPTGYLLNDSAILFEVDKDGNVIHQNKKVKLLSFINYNNGFYVSSFERDKDIELKGATLVIKNENGTEVIQFTSTEKAHMIKGIPEGKYTLSELGARDGFVLNS